MVTLGAIIILFIPRAVMATSAAVMNTLRIIGGAIGPGELSGAIMQSYLVPVTVDGEEQLFPRAVAFNIIFFICFILDTVLTIAVVLLLRNRATKMTSASLSTAK